MENKQTAVEWFYYKIKSHFEHDGDLLETLVMTMVIAKEKEREQIMDAWKDGSVPDIDLIAYAERYYDETYGK